MTVATNVSVSRTDETTVIEVDQITITIDFPTSLATDLTSILNRAAELWIDKHGHENWDVNSSGTFAITFLGAAEDAWRKTHRERFPHMHRPTR